MHYLTKAEFTGLSKISNTYKKISELTDDEYDALHGQVSGFISMYSGYVEPTTIDEQTAVPTVIKTGAAFLMFEAFVKNLKTVDKKIVDVSNDLYSKGIDLLSNYKPAVVGSIGDMYE
tara:strand:+ start:286 stop:639 length:354 start_codon:yes stop_codon:yes gene_type:complete